MPQGRKKNMLLTSFLLIAALIFFIGTSQIWAEDVEDADKKEETSNEFVLEETEVTASRRTQKIQDIPNSISAIDSNTIKESRVQTLQDVMEFVPNASLEQSGVGDNQVVVIRGVGQTRARVSEAAFGLYRNGSYYGGARTNVGNLVDLKRIEILRGPQGGLYGRNAVAGTVNMIYAMPTNSFEGSVSALYGSNELIELEGVINVPVVKDKFALRAVGWHHDQNEGEYYNDYLNEYIDKKNDQGVRLSARWNLTPDLEVTWSVEQQSTESPEYTAFLEELGETKETIMRDSQSLIETNFIYFSQDIDWQTKAGTFQLSTTYRDYAMDGIGDNDFTSFISPPNMAFPFPFNAVGIPQQIITREDNVDDSFMEGRWISNPDNPVTWVAGITYFKEDLESNFAVNVNSLAPDPVNIGSMATGSINSDAFIETESISVWGETTWTATEKLDLIASLRYSRDKKDLDFSSYNLSDSFVNVGMVVPFTMILDGVVAPLGNVKDSSTFEQWSPGAGVRYEFDSDLSVYARVNTGFRAGGFNTTTTVAANLPYQEETSVNYEIGIKSVLFDRARVNLSTFMLVQNDLLMARDDPNNPQFSYFENIGESETLGVEFEIDAMLTSSWTFSTAFGWLNGEITKGDENGVDISGENIPGVPDFTIALGTSYTFPVADMADITLRANYRHRWGGETDYSFNNEAKLEEHSLLDLSVIVTKNQWQLMGFVNNAFDDQYRIGTPVLADPGRAIREAEGRILGIKLTYQF